MYDYVIIGGGIVGLSTAWQLIQREPGASIVLIEKETEVATHQTGRNSGVIHAGIYYPPDSLKARLCREGVTATVDFCEEHGVVMDAGEFTDYKHETLLDVFRDLVAKVKKRS